HQRNAAGDFRPQRLLAPVTTPAHFQHAIHPQRHLADPETVFSLGTGATQSRLVSRPEELAVERHDRRQKRLEQARQFLHLDRHLLENTDAQAIAALMPELYSRVRIIRMDVEPHLVTTLL